MSAQVRRLPGDAFAFLRADEHACRKRTPLTAARSSPAMRSTGLRSNAKSPWVTGFSPSTPMATGRQTVCGNSMSHWCWHPFPLPAGVTPGTAQALGRLGIGPSERAHDSAARSDLLWQRVNRNCSTLSASASPARTASASNRPRFARRAAAWTFWSGLLVSRFHYRGEPVDVETCVAPESDTVAV